MNMQMQKKTPDRKAKKGAAAMLTPRSRGSHSGRDAAAASMARAEEAEPHDAVRHAMIAEAAYFRAQGRGFEPGHEIDDWFCAEAEIARACREGRDL